MVRGMAALAIIARHVRVPLGGRDTVNVIGKQL